MQCIRVDNQLDPVVLLAASAGGNMGGAIGAVRRRRGPSLSRRTGQNGSVFQVKQTTWNPKVMAWGQYWVDTPEGRKHRSVALGLHPTKTRARCKLREFIEEQGVNDKALFIANAPDLMFRDQAEDWIKSVATRRRRPAKPSTIHGYRYALDKWVLPHFGDMPLSEVSNTALRGFVDAMRAAKTWGDKAIVEYSRIVKSVVASAVNSDGEPIHKVTWNNDFVDMPIVDKKKQKRPSFTSADMDELLSKARPHPRWWTLFAVFGGSGLRPEEVLALRTTHVSQDGSVIYVRRSLYLGHDREGTKSENGVRDVEIAEPLASVLRQWMIGRTGYLFATKSGKPMGERAVLRYLSVTLGKKGGLRQFRRFRAATLRKARCPEDLIKIWLGHAPTTVTDLYASGLKEDQEWRREWCDKVGLGFQKNNVELSPAPMQHVVESVQLQETAAT
jgi:integrase